METAYIIRNGVIIGSGSSSSVGKDGVQIDDETASTDTVWSSKKTSDEIAKKADKSYVDDNFATMDKVPESVVNPTELDTNKFLKSGYYSLGDARDRTNLPIQNVGTLLVYYAGHYVIQEYILNENQRTFMRRSTDKGANWSAWTELATMDKVKDGYAKIIKNNDTDTNDAMFIAYKNRDLFGVRIYKDDNSEHELRFSASGISYVKDGVTVWTK